MTAADAVVASAEGPDLAEAKRFLDALAPGEQITFQTFDDRGKRKELARVLHGALDQHAAELSALNQQGAGIFVMVNAGDFKGRAAANVQKVRALFVDLDGARLEPVLQCGVTPHIICNSSPGRWHAYWLVSDCTLQDFKPLQQALAAKFGGDSSVNDLPRVMRLPGFYHCKGEPVLTTVRSIDNRPPYTVAQLTQGVGLTRATQPPNAPMLGPAAQSSNAPASLGPDGKRINADFEVPPDYPPAYADLIADSCAQLREMRDTRGKIKYPLWYDCLGVLVHTVNGDDVSHAWSAGHAKYSRDETTRKLAGFRAGEIRPTRCDTFESHNPKDCAGCAHRGKITSPIQLGNVHRLTPETPPRVEAPHAAPAAPQSQGAGGAMTAPYVAQPTALAFGAPAAATPQRLFDLSEANVRNFLMTAPPPRRYLLKDCLPVGKVGAIIAPGGTGKSQFVLQLAISIASGLPLAGGAWEVGESGGVLALFAEDDSEEVGRRLHYTVKSLESIAGTRDLIETLPSRLFVRSMVAEDNLMTAQEPGRNRIYRTSYADKLIVTARDIPELKLIVIDPMSQFQGGDELSSSDITRFITTLAHISNETGAAVLMVHHATKASMTGREQTQSAARGSSAISDGVRWQMNLATMTADEAKACDIPDDQRRMYLSAGVTKNNYAAPQPPVFLRRTENGILSKADLAERSQRKEETVTLQILQKIATSEDQYSARSFADTFHGESGSFAMGQNALVRCVNQAIGHGYLGRGSTGRHWLTVTDTGKAMLQVAGLAK